jgi:hypothetical protein
MVQQTVECIRATFPEHNKLKPCKIQGVLRAYGRAHIITSPRLRSKKALKYAICSLKPQLISR